MKKLVFMFPGQGSQEVGMGKDLYKQYSTVQGIYNRAKEILDIDLKKIMFEGPKDELTATENAQPALLLSSVATFRLLEEKGITPTFVIGHSLGEYSALVAAKSLPLEIALPLVITRGKLMEKAFPKGQGSMTAVLGLSEQEIKEILEQLPENRIVDLANLNCPGQIVISGDVEGLEQAEPLLLEAGARRVIRLNVSGPFHSRLMKRANQDFEKYLHEITFSDAAVPLYANVTADQVTDREEIKALLLKQLYSPVRFEESIRNILKEDVDAFIEVGHGRVLSGLVRKIDRKIKTFSIQNSTSLEKFLEWYKEA